MKRYIGYFATGLLSIGIYSTVKAQTTQKTLFDRFPHSQWVCGGFEENMKVLPGSHGSIILFADVPATNEHDRQICLLVEDDTVDVVMKGKR